jgi:hypothetical protein
MPNTYTELLKTTVGTATSSVTLDLTGISGYTDLVLVINNTHSTNAVDGWFRLNGDTGSNYSRTNLSGDGSSASSGRNSNVAFGYGILVFTTPSTNILQFMNYANTTTYKTVLMRSNNAGNYVQATVDLWRNTNAITSIEIGCASGNFAVGSTFSLYGIANADQGAAKATGGIITEDSTYWYHTFVASGTFTPKQSLSCDVLAVAGGGSGGGQYAGGGGAGGVVYDGARSLTATGYTVTIGGGGTAISSSSSNGNTGTNTSFDTLVANGGGGGGSWNGTGANGVTGGSGGGGSMGTSSGNTTSGGVATQGVSTGDLGYGTAGGGGLRSGSFFLGGGGGGAGVAGSAASGSVAGDGGAGINTYSSWLTVTGAGVSGYLAGGGGGGSEGGTRGAGGAGGGGQGGLAGGGTNGTANTGGGGGGVGYNATQLSGAGGSGVVIVRYAK